VLANSPAGELCQHCVSEGGLEPVERPLDKPVSDILSAKMDPGGPGCTPLLRIGALQERTKVAPDNDPGTKSGPGMSDPGPLVMGVELGYESVDPDCGAWIDKALRWRGPDNAKQDMLWVRGRGVGRRGGRGTGPCL
jgi:hypothetical protein